MSNCIVRMNGLTKKYKEHTAVNHLNMEIKKGQICGFIGENGAGKTTTIRLITGIACPTSGALELFGKTQRSDLQKMRRRIGCIIESPALYPEMTAQENIESMRIAMGLKKKNYAQELLNMVGLSDTGSKKAKNFSLGMRQRLGLALALLGDSEFLILDEPTNGLDPVGIMEMRQILLKINKEFGITMLVSSHLLSELYLIAERFIILHKGVIAEQITVDELSEKCSKYVKLEVNDPERAMSILNSAIKPKKMEIMPDQSICIRDSVDKTEYISDALLKNSIGIRRLEICEEDLETYFSKVIGGNI